MVISPSAPAVVVVPLFFQADGFEAGHPLLYSNSWFHSLFSFTRMSDYIMAMTRTTLNCEVVDGSRVYLPVTKPV
jgi:hypothetical protein